MKKLKKIAFILLGCISIIAIALTLFIHSLKPTYEGTTELMHLGKEVSVYYDSYGIPHIYTDNDLDAYRALGYVHAQDRLWQMELLRRIASGRLSEVFGADLVNTDRFFLSLDIAEATKKTVAKQNKEAPSILLSEAYLDGINQFIKEGPTPVEYYLTGLDKTAFTLEDVYNTMGYMAFSFAMAHKTDPLLSTLKDTLGTAYLKDLEVGFTAGTERIPTYNQSYIDSIQSTLSSTVSAALSAINIPLFEGSNSWVIGSKKTKNGKVIFANDPHIGFAQPSVWYEAHIETKSFSKYGYYMAGIPFPLLGHNRQLAYGMTMFENDDVDFYYEENNPSNENQYTYLGDYQDYELITKDIVVKDGENLRFTYKKSIHGSVLNGIADQISGDRPIAMYWVYTQLENKIMDALYGLSYASNLKEFKSVLPKIHAPGLNIMYGDAENNIAWFATAQLYQIPDSINTKMIFEVGKGLPVKRNLLNFAENPQAINPPSQFVYSANNQPDSIAGMLYPGYYLPENRAKRIVRMLEPKNDWDMRATKQMITDVTSSVDAKILLDMVKSISMKEQDDFGKLVLNKLKKWDGAYSLQSTEATVYNRWIYFCLKNTFHDELGEKLFEQLLETHLLKRSIAPLLKNTTSIWWDNVNTKSQKETINDVLQLSFLEAINSLRKDFGSTVEDWTWNKVHTLEHEHPIGKVAALRSFFNVGPYPVSGGREVINNLGFKYNESGFYRSNSGPSTRRIIDFSDVENSVSILPTGQSGNPFSPHYKDQADLYVRGEFRKMMMNKDQIQKEAKLLTFKPKE